MYIFSADIHWWPIDWRFINQWIASFKHPHFGLVAYFRWQRFLWWWWWW